MIDSGIEAPSLSGGPQGGPTRQPSTKRVISKLETPLLHKSDAPLHRHEGVGSEGGWVNPGLSPRRQRRPDLALSQGQMSQCGPSIQSHVRRGQRGAGNLSFRSGGQFQS